MSKNIIPLDHFDIPEIWDNFSEKILDCLHTILLSALHLNKNIEILSDLTGDEVNELDEKGIKWYAETYEKSIDELYDTVLAYDYHVKKLNEVKIKVVVDEEKTAFIKSELPVYTVVAT